MDRIEHEELIDLGAASAKTQGIPPKQEDLGGVGVPAGLSDDD